MFPSEFRHSVGTTGGSRVMFQIVSTMALELPSFLGELGILKGMSPNVQLTFEPHDNHEDVDCECQASDRTAAYVHDCTINL